MKLKHFILGIIILIVITLVVFALIIGGGERTPDKDKHNFSDGTNSENGGLVNEFIKLESGEVVFRGRITEIEKNAIYFDIMDSDVAFGNYRANVSKATPYYDINGEKITKDDLKVGDVIEVVFGGQVMRSMPPQISALRVYLSE